MLSRIITIILTITISSCCYRTTSGCIPIKLHQPKSTCRSFCGDDKGCMDYECPNDPNTTNYK